MAIRTPNNTAVVTVTYLDEQFPSQAKLNSHKRRTLEQMAVHFEALAAGTRQGTVTVLTNGGSNGTAASGTVTYATASGTTTVNVNGVAFAQTTGTDTARAAQLAADIVASVNPLVQPFVTATSAAGVTTIVSKTKGAGGNLNTLTATGTGVTASGSGRLTGGVDGTVNTVTV